MNNITIGFKWLADAFHEIIDLYDSLSFTFFGVRVSLLGIILAFMFFGFIASYFWKGASTK